MTANPLFCVVESRPQDHTLLMWNANNSTKYQALLYKVVQQLRRSGRNCLETTVDIFKAG